MADLTDIQSAGATKIIGSDTTGVETYPVNADSSGNLSTKVNNGSGSDAVNIQDGGNSITVDGEVKTDNTLTSGGTQGVLTLTLANTAYELKVGASRLTGRKLITAIPIDRTVYWGYTNAVTVTTGTPLIKSQFISWEMDDVGSVWLICDQAAKTVRITESP